MKSTPGLRKAFDLNAACHGADTRNFFFALSLFFFSAWPHGKMRVGPVEL
jgi:hypothetical protein